jgi:adenylyltransferase/sulfurtransferase
VKALFNVISVAELKAKMDAGENFRLIDVREPSEYHLAKIPGAELKPLGQIMLWAQQLPDKDEEIVLHCHHGMRSQRACEFLARQGFTRLHNLAGGIDEWSLRIDPSVPRY